MSRLPTTHFFDCDQKMAVFARDLKYPEVGVLANYSGQIDACFGCCFSATGTTCKSLGLSCDKWENLKFYTQCYRTPFQVLPRSWLMADSRCNQHCQMILTHYHPLRRSALELFPWVSQIGKRSEFWPTIGNLYPSYIIEEIDIIAGCSTEERCSVSFSATFSENVIILTIFVGFGMGNCFSNTIVSCWEDEPGHFFFKSEWITPMGSPFVSRHSNAAWLHRTPSRLC